MLCCTPAIPVAAALNACVTDCAALTTLCCVAESSGFPESAVNALNSPLMAVPISVEPAVAELPVIENTPSTWLITLASAAVDVCAWVCCCTRISSTRSRCETAVTCGPVVDSAVPLLNETVSPEVQAAVSVV